MALLIRQADYNKVIEHAKQGYPHETCGLLSGNEGVVKRFYPMVNSAASGTVYLMDSKQQLEVMQAIDDAGEEIVGIYHSHVASHAFPSATDVEQAFYPDASYVIVSLEDMESPDMRAYRIADGKIEEKQLQIVEGES